MKKITTELYMSNTTGAASETETAYSPDHRSSFSIFNGIRVAQSYFSMLYFVDHCLRCCSCMLGNCTV